MIWLAEPVRETTMPRRRVDYDQIASTYDRRFEADQEKAGEIVALLGLAREVGARRILEVGCGTARWLTDLRPVSERLYGLDLSTQMLAQARRRDERLYLARGRASRLPFPSASFDLVYCVNAIHHFDRQREFVCQARRLLRPGGALAVLGMEPHGRRESWYVYEFFEGTYETDLARFPRWGRVFDWMTAAGFERIEWRIVERIHDVKVGRAVLADPFLQKDATSQLTSLTDGEYAAGLRRIREAIGAAEARGRPRVFRSDILIGMLVGWTSPN